MILSELSVLLRVLSVKPSLDDYLTSLQRKVR